MNIVVNFSPFDVSYQFRLHWDNIDDVGAHRRAPTSIYVSKQKARFLIIRSAIGIDINP